MRVYITKYALTSGISEISAEECSDRSMVRSLDTSCTSFYHNNDWHLTRDEANAHAEKMRAKKIASLKKQLAKVESLIFD